LVGQRSLSINGHCKFAKLIRKGRAQKSHTHTAPSRIVIAGERVVRNWLEPPDNVSVLLCFHVNEWTVVNAEPLQCRLHVQAWHRFYWPTWTYCSRPPTGDSHNHVLTRLSQSKPQVSDYVVAVLATLVNGLSGTERLVGEPIG